MHFACQWDYLKLSAKAVAKDLGHTWPIRDYAAAIRSLFTEHYAFTDKSKYKSIADVDKAIEKRKDSLPEFYRESYMSYAWGGAPCAEARFDHSTTTTLTQMCSC